MNLYLKIIYELNSQTRERWYIWYLIEYLVSSDNVKVFDEIYNVIGRL